MCGPCCSSGSKRPTSVNFASHLPEFLNYWGKTDDLVVEIGEETGE